MGSVTLPEPITYARDWVEAWNARDLERVLADYAEDVVFTSPTAARLVPDSGGTVVGKAALRAYWTTALAAHPRLHFELREVYAGTGTIVINHVNEAGAVISEVLTFERGLIVRGHATHAVPIGA